jgi:hypothetical protein
LYQLGHEKGAKGLDKAKVTLGEIHEVLPETQGRAWKSIRELANKQPISRLSDLDGEERVKIKFLRISHIGKQYADKFYDAGCRSLKDLKAEKKVSLTKAQRVCLDHYEDMEQLIPRVYISIRVGVQLLIDRNSEVEEIKDILFKAVKEVDRKLECDILGSYRRGNGASKSSFD